MDVVLAEIFGEKLIYHVWLRLISYSEAGNKNTLEWKLNPIYVQALVFLEWSNKKILEC